MEDESQTGGIILNFTAEPVRKKSESKRSLHNANVLSANKKAASSQETVPQPPYGFKTGKSGNELSARKKSENVESPQFQSLYFSLTCAPLHVSPNTVLISDNINVPESGTSARLAAEKKRKFQSLDEKPDISGQLPKKARSELHTSSLFKSNPEIPTVKISQVQPKKERLFSETTFADLKLHPHLVSCLQNRLSISKLTEVQLNTIPVLLEKKDALVKSCTGSGKTLAYAVPVVQDLQEMTPKIQRSDGIFALIIVPTRELALQNFECFSTLTKAFTWIVPGYLIGGEKKKSEKARIRKGINILISTPGRLIDHLEHTANLDLKCIKWLVIDEADKLLEQGFEEAVLKILSHASPGFRKRQSVLLSATLSKGVENLAGISLTNPVYIDIAGSEMSQGTEELVIPPQLEQYFVITPTKLRLVSLSAFLVDKCASSNLKALIFMSAQKDVDFHYAIFSQVLRNLIKFKDYKCNFFKLHGNMPQKDRFDIFNSFRNTKGGILLCTDVAARGLDLPCVDWIVQFSVPMSAENYVHRVGRTARIGKEGHSLLFIMPSEVEFVKLLQNHKIKLEELAIKDLLKPLLLISEALDEDTNKRRYSRPVEEYATALQNEYENVVYSDNTVHESAKEAFLSYVHAYASYPKQLRPLVPFKMLHLGHVAKSFCLRESPSALGCRFAKQPHKPAFRTKKDHGYNQDKKGQAFRTEKDYRMPKHVNSIAAVSEYASGLDQLPKISGKRLKTKHSKKRKF